MITKVRKQNTDQKRQHILQVVRSILAKNGYAGTTISLVANEAKISRGLLHYYFKNKEDMLATVIRENMEVSVGMVEQVFMQSDSAESIAKQMTAALRFILESDPDFFNLLFEGWAVSRHSKTVEEEIKDLYDRFRRAIASGLHDATERRIISPALANDGLATVLTGIVDGLGLQLVTEPNLISDESIWQTTEKAIEMLLGNKN